MFDFFKNKRSESNVVPFPQKEECKGCSLDTDVPSKKEKPHTTFYRIGITDSNRITFQMGYSEITMNKQGVQNLIDQLELFKNQINEEDE